MAALFRLLPVLFPIQAGDIAQAGFHSVRFTDREGNLLQEVLSRDDSRTLHVPLGEISPYFSSAMIAAEDRRFNDHGGVDYGAVLRALYLNIRAGRVVSGGSTITLQLARMLRPDRRTAGVKLRETFTAWRMEAGMGKEEILEAYLNRLPLGGNIYGVEAGARSILGVRAADLSLAQATFLAAIPNSPVRLNPYSSAAAVKRRQRHVLARMVATGVIDAERGSLAAEETLSLRRQEVSFLAPHLVFHLLEDLPPEVETVQTTIDSEVQMLVSRQVREVVRKLETRRVTNAAALLLENATGEVLAYVGSADFFDSTAGGQNDGVQALRQPGSTLKPFLYGLAFEGRHTPASLLADVPTSLPMPKGVFRPKNYSETFHGPVRAREALANSLNVPAVRLITDIGVEPFLVMLRTFGFTSLDRTADYYGAGLALGDGEVRLAELAGAYLALAAGGERVPIRFVRSAKGSLPEGDGNLDRPASIMDPRAAFLVTSILSDRFARSTAFGTGSVLTLPFPCAVKTGTSFRFADNWTVGFTDHHTLAVWTGNFDGTPMQNVSGVSGAGPLFSRIMTSIYAGKEDPHTFQPPPGVAEAAVCTLSGKAPTPFCTRTVEEFFLEETIGPAGGSPCDMHLPEGTVYPPPFRGWALDAGLLQKGGTPAPSSSREGFAIVRPADGTIYRRLPDLDPQYQSIPFELRSPPEEGAVQWLLDGRQIAVTHPPHSHLWKAEKGEHRLLAVAPASGEETPPVRFTVR